MAASAIAEIARAAEANGYAAVHVTESVDERRVSLERLSAMGVTWLPIAPTGEDRAEYLERAGAFAKEFVDVHRRW